MDSKKIITILSIIVTAILIITSAILIINKNNKSTKQAIAEQNMENQEIVDGTENPTGEPTEESSSPSPSASPTPHVPVGKYYIKVNTQANTVTVYIKDENGEYTIPVKAMICSTGKKTPQNTKHTLKYRWTWLEMIGGVYAQYVTQVKGDICFHSVPYLKKNPATLEYWLYDKLGTTCSAGCIRLTTIDAMWIYNNCASGTTVEFYKSSNPGPLGKPSAMKINKTKYAGYQNWDPTDPRPENPWRNFVEETPSPEITPTPELTPTPVITLERTPTPTIEPIATPTTQPTQTPVATPTPVVIATPTPVTTPVAPTATPTQQPVVPDGPTEE